MRKESPQCSLAVLVLAYAMCTCAAAQSTATVNPPTPGNPPVVASTAAAPAPPPTVIPPLQITGLVENLCAPPINGKDSNNHDIQSHIGLNNKLWVLLNRAPSLPANRYVLFLNGVEIKNLDAARDATCQARGQPLVHALVFTVKRDNDSDVFWKDLLGSPSVTHVPVTVSLGEQATAGQSSQATIVGADPSKSAFEFEVFTPFRLALAFFVALVVVVLVWGHARTRTTLRDNLLPQLEASRQTYSLGRWQMAFWFTLVFVAFVFLFLLLQDTNTLTAQALALMGISGVTAAASVAVDVDKNSPADDANRGLQALGLKTYDDVLRVRAEIAQREPELANIPAPPPRRLGDTSPLSPEEQRRAQLQTEIQDRRNVLRTYAEKTRPFVSEGWFKDITTDLNGIALHRLQSLCWTVTLGVIFVYGVYRGLAMPEFSGTLLALMGISSAGYVGFKIQEVNN
jgi:hypothetical protein